MKQSKVKSEHYSTLKTILRVITLGIALWALIMAYQNRQAIKWLESEHDNVIERLMFPNR